MNHIYRSIWNEALGAWVAVSEHSKGQGKHGSTGRKLLVTGLLVCASPVWALPTGDQLVAGQASVSNPAANIMQIDQASQKAAINWQGFSIGQNEAVNINQPNAQAALLNRVVGQDASQIQGQLNANGQVYLVNPNGVIFGKTAQVDVGGLVASTHNITDTDFINGNHHFTQDGATGTVENHGTINTGNGGVVALIGEKVSNTGNINTPQGTTALAAGKTVDLDFQGNGLVEVKISEAALNAQITNQGAIQADGGRVVLTAKAAGQLVDTVINQQGIIKAQGLVERNGEIILDGGNSGIVQVSGTLDTDGQTGGKIRVVGDNIQINNGASITASGDNSGGVITIGDKLATRQTTVQQGATVNVDSKNQGNAGKIDVLANMSNGTVNVAGQLNATAAQGDGGFIDTSASHVNIADTAKISTKADQGKTGTWLIDPTDFTIELGSGLQTVSSIGASTLSSNLANTSVIIATSAATAGNGDIFVNEPVNWFANTLTLSAHRNININADLNGSGTAKLALLYGQASANGGTDDNYFINNGAKVNLAAGQNFSTQKGSAIANLKNYTVITSLGAQGDATVAPTTMTLQSMNTALAGNYVLGGDIDATATSTWNLVGGVYQGFRPIGGLNGFTGNFDGLGHTITGININNQANSVFVGLFSTTSGSSISNIGLVGGNIVAPFSSSVGGLIGGAANTIIRNSYVTSNVIGSSYVGGLVGQVAQTLNNLGQPIYTTISNSYVTGNVTGTSGQVGGLVGLGNNLLINNSYATGNVTSNGDTVGGLVAINASGSTITNSYATGKVTGTTSVGGLVGSNAGTISNSFWDTTTTGQTKAAGTNTGAINANTTGKTTAQMKQMSTFSGAGWDIANTGGSTAVWRIYEGNTTPLLRSFLKPLTINPDGTYSITGVDTSHLFTSGTGIYSDQQGYDIAFVSAPPPIPAVVKPSDDLIREQEHQFKIAIQANLINLNVFLSQLNQLQISTTFLDQLKQILANFDNSVDVDYGQYKGNNGSTIHANYGWHRGHGKKDWYEKHHNINLRNILDGLLLMIQNGGIKLPNGVITFIPNNNSANSNSSF